MMILQSLRNIFTTPQDEPGKRYALIIYSAIFVGIFLGIFVVWILPNVPPIYILIGLGALLFAYLLLFHIDIAVILALFIYHETGRFNYMGGGTPFHPNGLLGISIIGATIFYFIFRRIDFSRLPGVIPFMGYLIVCIFSLLFTEERLMDGVTITLRLMTALSIYAVLVYKLDSIKMVNWAILAIAGSQITPTITRLLALFRGNIINTESNEPVRTGTSTVGAFLALILTLSFIQLINTRKTSERILWGCLVVLFSLGLFFSYGRAGWIGFIVALLVIGCMKYKKLLVILPIGLILLVVLVPAIPQRFSDISLSEINNRSSSTLAVRYEIWRGAIEVAKNNLLFGVGYGVGRYRVGELLGRYSWMIHNDYISVLLETGIVGLIIFMFWHSQWLFLIFNVYKNSKFKYDKILSLGIFAIFIASLVIRLTDNILQDAYKLYYLSGLIAIALTLPRIRAKEEINNLMVPAEKAI